MMEDMKLTSIGYQMDGKKSNQIIGNLQCIGKKLMTNGM